MRPPPLPPARQPIPIPPPPLVLPAAAADAARAADVALLPAHAHTAPPAAAAAEAAAHAYIAAYNAYIVTGVEHTIAADRATIMWAAVRADAATILDSSAGALADMPLRPHSKPEWPEAAWASLRTLLPMDEDWDVWIDWYEQRLRGGTRGEDYELVFASVPEEEWEKDPVAPNAWIKANLPAVPIVGVGEAVPQIRSQVALRGWLEGQSAQTSVAIAVRSALRVLHLTIRQTQFQSRTTAAHQFAVLAGLMFRWTARALGTARYRVTQPVSDQIAIEVSAGPAARAGLTPLFQLGSGLIDQSQKATAAAIQVWAQRSYRVWMRRQSLSRLQLGVQAAFGAPDTSGNRPFFRGLRLCDAPLDAWRRS